MAEDGCCKKCGEGIKLALRRLRVLLWKNWLLRKRKCCCAVSEVIVPILFALGFVGFVWLLPVIWYDKATKADPLTGIPSKPVNDPSIQYHTSLSWEMTKEEKEPFNADEAKLMEKTREIFNPSSTSSYYPYPGSSGSGYPGSSYPGSSGSTGPPVLAYAPYTPLTEEIMRLTVINLGSPASLAVESFDNYAEIEAKTDEGGKLVAAIIFEKGFKSNKALADLSTKFENGHTFSYIIRLREPDNTGGGVPFTGNAATVEFQTTRHFLYKNEVYGDNKIEKFVNRYADSGFAGLQIGVDKAIIEWVTKKKVEEKVNIKAAPYKAQLYGKLDFAHVVVHMVFPACIFLPFVMVVLFVAMRVGQEKKSGVKELMKMSGLSSWMHWTTWMIDSLVLHLITIFGILVWLIIPYGKYTAVIVLGVYHNHFTLWFFVLLMFVAAATAFAFFFSSLISNPTVAGLLGYFTYVLTGLAVVFFAGRPAQYPSFAYKMATSLVPSAALHWIIVALWSLQTLDDLYHENKVTDPYLMREDRVGGKWGTMGVVVDNMSVGYGVLMLFVDTVVYTLLAVYMENVWPGEYGARRPFYYFLIPPESVIKWFRKLNRVDDGSEGDQVDKPGFETEPDLPATVEVKNLRKRFGLHKLAVNGISFKMYEGQITVLLGHNGAGKTTAMSMLSGLLAPSSGTALVNGYDMNREMEKIRRNMGLCPQQSMVFERLNVFEHLQLFAMIKGLSIKEGAASATACLEKLGLKEKKNAKPKTLSGGEKRKLCLGMALIGDTTFLILDEPTSGMDPENRRVVWDLLLNCREGRTILLTTHFMEEADTLGDRILIMAEGQIKCSGSPMFLKQVYGTGYTLKLTTSSDAYNEATCKTVMNYVPKATIKDPKLLNPTELALRLPDENNINSVFPDLFNELSRKKAELGILTMNLQVTTMDEVFLKVGELSLKEEGTVVKPFKELYEQRVTRKMKGCKLALRQFYALLMKRLLFTARKPLLVIVQILFPLVMMYMTVIIYNILVPAPKGNFAPLEMTLSNYDSTLSYYSASDEKFEKAYAEVVGLSANKVSSAVKALEKASETDRWDYKRKYVIGAEYKKSKTEVTATALFSPYAIHSCPLSINFITNAIFQKNSEKTLRIEVISHPMKRKTEKPNPLDDILGALYSMFTQQIAIVFLKLGLCVFGALFIIFPMTEKLCGAKLLQMMTGVGSFVYWLPSFLFDYVVVLITAGLMLVVLHVFHPGEDAVNFNTDNGYGIFFFVFCIYGFGAISYAYMYHRGPRSISGAVISLIILPFLFEFAVQSGVSFVTQNGRILLGGLLSGEWVFYIGRVVHVLMIIAFPVYGGASCASKFMKLAQEHDSCVKQLKVVKNGCDPKGPNPIPQCCTNCMELEDKPEGLRCMREHYLKMTTQTLHFSPDGGGGPSGRVRGSSGTGPGAGGGPQLLGDLGLGLELLFLFLAGCLYTVLYFWIEHQAVKAKIAVPEKKKKKKGEVEGDEVQGNPNTYGQNQYTGQPMPPYQYGGPPMTPSNQYVGQPMSPNASQTGMPAAGQQMPPNVGQVMPPNAGPGPPMPRNAGQPMAPNAGQQMPPYANQQMPPYANQQMPPYAGQPMQSNQYGAQQMPPNQYGGQQMPPYQYGGQQPPPNQYGGQQMPPYQYGGQQPPPNQYGGQQMPPYQYGGQQPPPNQYGGQQMPPYQYGGQQMPPNQYRSQERPPNEDKDKPKKKDGKEKEDEYKDYRPPGPIQENDVLAEMFRVQELVDTGRANEDALVVDNLTRNFGPFVAVSALTFGVHYGECFGLLGVNGAGKTTAFRMLTGDESVTRGTAYTHSFSLFTNTKQYLQNLGYCPQNDAFFSMFTGKQMLELYCRLRGIDASPSAEAERWLTLFGLLESANIKCENYSGGMKRRINAAIAMIGDPSVILFDEPTSGVDPMAQHQFWDMIMSMRGTEQAVVLTSHSMSECDTLCSRLGIMVNGQFQCFGGPENLKSKYGEGYTLFVKLKPAVKPESLAALQYEIHRVFYPCKLQDQHLNIIQYHVMNAKMSYGEIFTATENLKTKFIELIQEYSVNDTTLEEVFLSFARMQYRIRKPAKEKCTCRRCIFCDSDCCNCD